MIKVEKSNKSRTYQTNYFDDEEKKKNFGTMITKIEK